MANQKNYYEAKDEFRYQLIKIVEEKRLSGEQILLLLNELQGEIIQNIINTQIGH